MKHLIFLIFSLFIYEFTFSQGNYCKPKSECELVYAHTTADIPAQLSIVRVEFDGQYTNYSNYNRAKCETEGYQDFFATKGIVEQAGEYDINVVAQPYSNQYSASGYLCQIWCDWDMDLEFEDEELTVITSDQAAAFETFTLSFPGKLVVPATANIGSTRMRIRVHHSSNYPEPYVQTDFLDAVPDTMPGPCDTTRTGEVEDYGLLVYSESPGRSNYCTGSGPEFCRGSRLDITGPNGERLPTRYEFVYIDTVRIEGADSSSIENTSNLGECQADGSYSDYTKKYKVPPSWTRDSTYQIYVSRVDSLDTLGSSCGIYIDWNNDFDFEDPNEEYIDYISSLTTDDNNHYFSISVPFDVENGRKRVRIRTTQGQATPAACGERYNTGEVEDYEIFVSDSGEAATFLGCVHDTTASPNDVITVCQSGVTFDWGLPEGDQPNGFYFSIGTDNPPTNLVNRRDVGAVLNYALPEKLNFNTRYYWQVIPYNQNGENNVPCEPFEFRTGFQPDPTVKLEGFDVINDTVIMCPNVPTTIKAKVTGGNGVKTLQWFGAGQYLIAGGGTSDSITYVSNMFTTGDYAVRVEDANGCSGEDQVHVITKEPASAGTLQGLRTVCKYSDLTVSVTGSKGKLQWQKYDPFRKVWNDMPGEKGTSITFTNIKFPNTYRVYADLDNCGDTLASFVVKSYPIPAKPAISSDIGEFLCGGDVAVLTSTYTGTGGNVWNTGDTANSISTNKHGKYTVYYFNGNGCNSDTAEFQLIDYPDPPKPIINSNNGFGFCQFDSITLSVDANGADFYWNGKTNNRNVDLNIKAPGTFYATTVNPGGCTATSDTVTVEVYPLPDKLPVESVNGLFRFCEGSSVNLTVGGNYEINWLGSSLNKGRLFNVDRPGVVFAKLISSEGCINYTDTVAVSEVANPTPPSLKLLDPQEYYCYYQTPKVYASNNEHSITWTHDSKLKTDTITVTEKGTYSAVVANGFGCSAATNSVFVNIMDTMVIPTVERMGDSLIVEVPSGYSIQWYLDGLPIPFANSPFFIPEVDGDFAVRVIDEFGCLSFSSGFDFRYGQTTGINEHNGFSITIAPNPVNAGGNFNVDSPEAIKEIILVDAAGKHVAKSQNSQTISTNNLSAGTYIIQVQFKNQELIPLQRHVIIR